MEKFYDVVVIGAGPAGLAVASEISKKLKVLIIDGKKEIKETPRSWFIPKFMCDDGNADEIIPYTYNGVRRFLADTFSGVTNKAWESTLDGGYLFVKEHEVLKFWAEKVLKNGSSVELDCSYLDHTVITYREDVPPVEIHTTKGNVSCKMIVDASGHDSMILKKYHLDQPYYWWSVYGMIKNHKNGIPENMKVGDYMMWQTFQNTNPDEEESLNGGRPVFEYEVFDEKTSFPLLLFLRKEKISKEIMKNYFTEIMNESKVLANYKDTEIIEEKWGWYPSGGLSQNIAEDHVVFAGDSACWTTPCGWGFAFIVKNYKNFSKAVIIAFENKKFKKDDLDELFKLKTAYKFQILFNKIATRTLSLGNTKIIDKLLEFFDKLGFIYCEKTFTLSLTKKNIEHLIINLFKEIDMELIKEIFDRDDIEWMLEEIKDGVEDKVSELFKGLFKKGE